MAGSFEKSQESHRHLRRSRWPSLRPAFVTRRVGGRATRSPCAPPWRRAYKRKHELELGGGRAPQGRVRRSEGNGRGGYAECTCAHNSQT